MSSLQARGVVRGGHLAGTSVSALLSLRSPRGIAVVGAEVALLVYEVVEWQSMSLWLRPKSPWRCDCRVRRGEGRQRLKINQAERDAATKDSTQENTH